MTPSRSRMALRAIPQALLLMAGGLVVVTACYVGVLAWTMRFPPRPVYTLTVYNQGELEIVGGYLSGDSLWRPVGQVLPGRATAFVFEGCGRRDDADYRLQLARSDSSKVSVHVGWITGDWSISTLSHDISVIPNDTATVCSLVVPMPNQNELMQRLRSKRLIDGPQP